MNTEEFIRTYLTELKAYKNTLQYPKGMVLHFYEVGNTGEWLATLTSYDKNGKKSENAVPFKTFIKVVDEIEDLGNVYKTKRFTGMLLGWNPSDIIKSFLRHKKVHRIMFISDENVLSFIKDFTQPDRVVKRKDNGVDVLVVVG